MTILTRPYWQQMGLDALLYSCNHLVSRAPSHAARKAFYRRAMGFDLRRTSNIFMGAWFYSRGKFSMGDCSVINERCRLDNRGGITIGENVSISAETCILTADHDVQHPDFLGRHRAVFIEDYAFVGTRAMILPGVHIGRGGVVAAGAVVTSDVAANTIVGGVPARKIADRNPEYRYNSLYWRRFN